MRVADGHPCGLDRLTLSRGGSKRGELLHSKPSRLFALLLLRLLQVKINSISPMIHRFYLQIFKAFWLD